MEFYQQALGGELEMATFEGCLAALDASDNDLVMPAKLTTPSGGVLVGADRPERMRFTPVDNISISLGGRERVELQGYCARRSSQSAKPGASDAVSGRWCRWRGGVPREFARW